MAYRGRGVGKDRSMCELFQCIEEFAGNMEDSFSIIHRNFTAFRIKLGELKKRHLIEVQNETMTKSQLAKKKAQSKSNKNKKKEEESSMKQELAKMLNEEVPVVTIDETEEQYPRAQSSIKSYWFQQASQNLQFELDDIVLDEVRTDMERQSLWNQFYQEERARLQQLDPKASNSDINKFAEAKWNTMSELEKIDWKNNIRKKREDRPKKASTMAKFLKEGNYQSRFSDFLNKKANKSLESGPAQSNNLQKIADTSQHQAPISATQLLSALQQNREKNQCEDTLKEDDKLKRIFRTFEL